MPLRTPSAPCAAASSAGGGPKVSTRTPAQAGRRRRRKVSAHTESLPRRGCSEGVAPLSKSHTSSAAGSLPASATSTRPAGDVAADGAGGSHVPAASPSASCVATAADAKRQKLNASVDSWAVGCAESLPSERSCERKAKEGGGVNQPPERDLRCGRARLPTLERAVAALSQQRVVCAGHGADPKHTAGRPVRPAVQSAAAGGTPRECGHRAPRGVCRTPSGRVPELHGAVCVPTRSAHAQNSRRRQSPVVSPRSPVSRDSRLSARLLHAPGEQQAAGEEGERLHVARVAAQHRHRVRRNLAPVRRHSCHAAAGGGGRERCSSPGVPASLLSPCSVLHRGARRHRLRRANEYRETDLRRERGASDVAQKRTTTHEAADEGRSSRGPSLLVARSCLGRRRHSYG